MKICFCSKITGVFDLIGSRIAELKNKKTVIFSWAFPVETSADGLDRGLMFIQNIIKNI